MSAAVEHIGEIESALSGVGSARDAFVVESWQRCVHEHGLDPAHPSPPVIIPDRKFRQHREQSERLIRIARSGMQELFRKVAGQNYVLLLCDRAGVTVDFFGDLTREAQLRRAGLYLGSMWTEHTAGTNGVG
ncbi:MAG: sigma-54-dependent Fis family transcriptional regulator, partial [Myxococcota bacterium]